MIELLQVNLECYLLNRQFMKIKSHNPNPDLQSQNPLKHNSSCNHNDKQNIGTTGNIAKLSKMVTRNQKKMGFTQALPDIGNKIKENQSSKNTMAKTTPHKSLMPILIPEEKSEHQNEQVNNIKVRQQAPYISEILVHLNHKSQANRVSSTYLRQHQHMTRQYRCSFIKHFFRLRKRFDLKRKTVFLAVFVMDSYFERNLHLDKQEATTCALASFWIAMKYEEIYPPELQEWTQPNTDIVQMESKILITLNFNLTVPTLEHYLEYHINRLSQKICNAVSKIEFLADICLFDENALYGYDIHELSLSLVYSIVERSRVEEKLQMSLKWMMERNQKYADWLQGLISGKNIMSLDAGVKGSK